MDRTTDDVQAMLTAIVEKKESLRELVGSPGFLVYCWTVMLNQIRRSYRNPKGCHVVAAKGGTDSLEAEEDFIPPLDSLVATEECEHATAGVRSA